MAAAMLFWATTAFAETTGEGRDAPKWEVAKELIGLLPETDSPYGAAGIRYLEQQIGRDLTAEERALFEYEAMGKWKTYRDDLISFDLPDSPLLSVESFVPEQSPPLRIVGSAVGTTDNTYQKVYRITAGEDIPYGIVLVTEEPWFDEGICLCGPIDLKTFALLDGNLIEMSQLPGGDVKKFQSLNDSHRAILFEWTHSAIIQSAYFRIGASLRLHPASDRSREEWIELSKLHRAFEAGLGWLRPGTTTDDMVDLLGKPERRSDSEVLFVREERADDGRGGRATYTLPISEGRLIRFDAGWAEYEELEAPRGTHAWIEDTLRAWEDKSEELPEGEAPSLPPEDVKLIFDRFHKQAGGSAGEDWDFWCGAIANLARLGVKNEEAAALAASRFSERDLPQSEARWVMELYELPGWKKLVRDRLGFLMEDSETAISHRNECHNLFASLERGHEASMALIRKGVTHDAEEIRRAAVYFVSKLPSEETLKILRTVLSDQSEGVRRSGILNVDDICTKADLDWLEAALRAETSERNKELLVEQIGRLE